MKYPLLKRTDHFPFSRRSRSVLTMALVLISANLVQLNLDIGEGVGGRGL